MTENEAGGLGVAPLGTPVVKRGRGRPKGPGPAKKTWSKRVTEVEARLLEETLRLARTPGSEYHEALYVTDRDVAGSGRILAGSTTGQPVTVTAVENPVVFTLIDGSGNADGPGLVQTC